MVVSKIITRPGSLGRIDPPAKSLPFLRGVIILVPTKTAE
jgi:hypothetical protein